MPRPVALVALLASLLFSGAAAAQTGYQFPSANLTFPSSDLSFSAADLTFPARPMCGGVK